MMSLLREIVREQQNQCEECRMLQSHFGSQGVLDLGCPLEYRVNQPGNRSAALEEMVTLERGMLSFRAQRPDAKYAIFPTLMDPRVLTSICPYYILHVRCTLYICAHKQRECTRTLRVLIYNEFLYLTIKRAVINNTKYEANLVIINQDVRNYNQIIFILVLLIKIYMQQSAEQPTYNKERYFSY